MQIVTNTRLVESRGKWGKRLTWIGLFFLFGAVFVFVVIGIIRDTLSFLKLVK